MGGAIVLGRAARGRRSGPARTCRRRPRRSGRCCSSTPSPAVARPRASRWPPKPARAGSSRSSSAPRGTSSGSCATRSRAAPTGWRWPAATARRPSSPRSPRSSTCPTPACRRARATTSRSTSASIAMTSSARSTRSSTAASAAWIWRRSTGACSSTTSRSGSTPTRSSAAATATRSCEPSSTPCPRCSGPRGPGSTCAGRARRPRARCGSRDPRLQQPLPAGPRGRLGHPPADRRRPARDHVAGRPDRRGGERPPAAATVAGMDGTGVRGRRRASRARRHRRRGDASWSRPCASASVPASCACASRASIPAPRRRRSSPRASGQSVRALARIAVGRDPLAHPPNEPTTKER